MRLREPTDDIVEASWDLDLNMGSGLKRESGSQGGNDGIRIAIVLVGS